MFTEDVRAMPVVVDLTTAGKVFGLGRDLSVVLAETGEFPTPVLRLGRRRMVTRAAILAALGIPDAPSNPLARGASSQVSDGSADNESAGREGAR
jgi:hypothetical protein